MTLYIGGDGRKIESVFIGTYSGYTEIREAYLNGSMVFKKRYPFDEVIYNTVGIHDFVVPDGNSFVDVEVYGARGQSLSAGGGAGGKVTCRISVIGGQHLYCYVGFIPTGGNIAQYNASDIRTYWNGDVTDTTSLNSRIVVAGGGGGGGQTGSGWGSWAGGGGAAGYPDGAAGGNVIPKYAAYGGGGATQSTFGGGGTSPHGNKEYSAGANGTFGLGGNGGSHWGRGGLGGHGGAGWYGGGGGCHSIHEDSDDDNWNMNPGGGGGSSYANTTYCSSVVYTGGNNNGNGWIKIKQVAI